MSSAIRRPVVPCPACVRRGVKVPSMVRPGYNCNDCADLEEGVG